MSGIRLSCRYYSAQFCELNAALLPLAADCCVAQTSDTCSSVYHMRTPISSVYLPSVLYAARLIMSAVVY
jgi:hypothetical protein